MIDDAFDNEAPEEIAEAKSGLSCKPIDRVFCAFPADYTDDLEV